MLKRTITGACYLAFITIFFLLRELVDTRLFHILTCAFTVLGTFEIARMTKPHAIKYNFIFAMIYGVLFVPLFVLFEYVLIKNFGYAVCLILFAVALIVVSLVCIIKKSSKTEYFCTLVSYAYPSLFLLSMLVMNELGAVAFVALLLTFVISPIADTMAYLVGSLIGGKKLCPRLSPKKTWSGAIGGLVGGAIGGIALFFICRGDLCFGVSQLATAFIMVAIGIVAAFFTEAGDLFESFIKRRAGVKDSGKILPGHGGVLDRIDGMLFASVFVCAVFLII